MKKTVDLFKGFSSTSFEEWNKQVAKDIDRSGYTKPLVWKTDEGFTVNPFYTAENIKDLLYLTDSLPGEYPFVRGNDNRGNDWDICVKIARKDISDSNKLAREALMNGADSITFSEISVDSIDEMSSLLKDISLCDTKLNFESVPNNFKVLDLLLQELKNKNIDPSKVSGTLYFSPLNELLSDGFLPFDSEECFTRAKEFIVFADHNAPYYKTLAVKGDSFSEAGSNIVQELAFSLLAGCEYLVKLREKGLSVDMISNKMVFQFSVGSSYFMEVAKLRAARNLWAKIVNKFRPEHYSSCKMTIHCITSLRNKTLYDPYVNVLRGTVESMAAIMGGCNSLCVLPFDYRSGSEENDSARLAHNTQLILKEESYLHKVTDPCAGSYYVEKLTDLISAEVLELFKNTEKNGGFIQGVNDSYIQDQIIEAGNSKMDKISSGKQYIVGITQSPNLEERIMDQMDTSDENLSCEDQDRGSRVVNPWRVKKLEKINWASLYEGLRLRTEKFEKQTGRFPKVFLLKMGDPVSRSARAVFSANFFGCAGYSIIEGAGFESIDEGVNEVVASGADIVVLCSADRDYAEVGADIVERIKSVHPKVIVVAGYPENIIDELIASGVDDFIHVGSELYATLSKYHKKLGVN